MRDTTSGVEQLEVVHDFDSHGVQSRFQLRRRRIVMAQVHGHNTGGIGDRAVATRCLQARGQAGEVEVPRAMVGLVTETLVNEHDRERATGNSVEDVRGERAGVGGVHQSLASRVL